MFSRKNQNILSSHYTKLVDRASPHPSRSANDGEDPEDEFFALKRIDHDLPAASDQLVHSDLSKRKIRMLKSKKAMAKSGPQGHKLVFDDEGQAHEIYEFKEWREGTDHEDGKQFIAKEIGRMRQADVHDKEEAKEKKREKKRKRKDREKEEVNATFPMNHVWVSHHTFDCSAEGHIIWLSSGYSTGVG
jgi:ATP-dependent RNA helicase DDX10/DBP4